MDTEIRERLFHVRLPGEWLRVPSESDDEGFCYRSTEIDAQLNVSIRLTKERLEAPEFLELFEWWIATSREQELSLAPDVELFEVQRWPREHAMFGLYQGKQTDGRRMANYVIVNSAGVASFYFEAYGLSGAEFGQKLKGILADINLVERT